MRRMFRAVVFLLVLAPVCTFLWTRGAETVPLFASRQGLQCQTCHFDPNGGGPRNEFGFNYAKNRHSLIPEGEDTAWGELDLVNRVGDSVPLFFGVNQRFMLLTNTTVNSDSLDRFGFANMQTAMHLVFQPHRRLTLVYTNDGGGFGTGQRTQEAYGMFTELPVNGYLKAGRIRNPFGLRMDDHTVATRNGFLDFIDGRTFLPFDPRSPDMGIEYGMERDGWFGRAAYTNGSSSGGFVLGSVGQRAEAKTMKLGYNTTSYQAAVSVYDVFSEVGTRQRATRWGYYGMTHFGPLALLGEIGAGTDEANTGVKRNLLAYWVELNWHPARPWNFRVRYDRAEYDRSSDQQIRDDNSFNRYALEGEWVPVPFAEIRGVLRRIERVGEATGPFGANEDNQAYLQFHFAY